MSDLMILGVLRMPVTPDSDYLTLKQYIDRGRQAADTIEQQQVKIDELAATVERLREAILDYQNKNHDLNILLVAATKTPHQNLNALKRETVKRAIVEFGLVTNTERCDEYDLIRLGEEYANETYPDKE